jgi:hypothetical protein
MQSEKISDFQTKAPPCVVITSGKGAFYGACRQSGVSWVFLGLWQAPTRQPAVAGGFFGFSFGCRGFVFRKRAKTSPGRRNGPGRGADTLFFFRYSSGLAGADGFG